METKMFIQGLLVSVAHCLHHYFPFGTLGLELQYYCVARNK